MSAERVAIVGAGLAGLNAARLLLQAGVDVRLFEARPRLGGRILTIGADGAPGPGFDLGPSWFWPDMQPEIAALVAELGLACHRQDDAGQMLFERSPHEAPLRVPHPGGVVSWRLAGGTGALVQVLAARIGAERIRLGTPVRRLTRAGREITLTLPDGEARADHVILALPPRLIDHALALDPAPPQAVRDLWRRTPTWMAPHAKIVAAYRRRFWREAGLSGGAQSLIGPMVEIHDATSSTGDPALFGFIGLPAAERRRIGEAGVIAACTAQFTRLFGPTASEPVALRLKDWAADRFTAAPRDLTAPGHPEPAAFGLPAPWSDSLTLAGSEAAPRDPGYLNGAVIASEAAARTVLARARV
ncbi:MAG: FAD-dependent oxidoreductase [Roseovarius sp.]|nr:FAD-dependent oxidoreductase [Roseovarius sp.]